MRTSPKNILMAAAIVAATSCSSVVGSDDGWHRVLGLISIGGEQQPPVEMPDTLHGTGTASVVVRTWGSSSCTRADGAVVEYGDFTIVIRPYDRVFTGGVCTDDLAPHPRDVQLSFDGTGAWTVQVVGRSFTNGHVFEKEVIVEPAAEPLILQR